MWVRDTISHFSTCSVFCLGRSIFFGFPFSRTSLDLYDCICMESTQCHHTSGNMGCDTNKWHLYYISYFVRRISIWRLVPSLGSDRFHCFDWWKSHYGYLWRRCRPLVLFLIRGTSKPQRLACAANASNFVRTIRCFVADLHSWDSVDIVSSSFRLQYIQRRHKVRGLKAVPGILGARVDD